MGQACILGLYFSKSWENLQGRPHWNQLPNFFDFRVSDRNASIGPIFRAMQTSHPGKSRLESMDFDIAAGLHAKFSSVLAIGGVGVRNVESQVKPTVRILEIDNVASLRRFVVPRALFRTNWLVAESNFISSEEFVAAHQFHGSIRFFHYNPVGDLQLRGKGAHRTKTKHYRHC